MAWVGVLCDYYRSKSNNNGYGAWVEWMAGGWHSPLLAMHGGRQVALGGFSWGPSSPCASSAAMHHPASLPPTPSGYTGSIVGDFSWDGIQGSNPRAVVWDISSVMHEIGHNFNSVRICLMGIMRLN